MGISLPLHLRKLGQQVEGPCPCPRRAAAGERVCQLPWFYYIKAIPMCAGGNVFKKTNVHMNGILVTRQQTLKLWAWETGHDLDLLKKTAQVVAGGNGAGIDQRVVRPA